MAKTWRPFPLDSCVIQAIPNTLVTSLPTGSPNRANADPSVVFPMTSHARVPGNQGTACSPECRPAWPRTTGDYRVRTGLGAGLRCGAALRVAVTAHGDG